MNFLLEIGTEELPAKDVWSALDQLKEKTPHLLRSKGLRPSKAEDIHVYGTPRRLVVYIRAIDAMGLKQPLTMAELIPSLIKSLHFEKSMRWLPKEGLTFSRPIRWLVAMLDDKLVPAEVFGVRSSTVSFGPRFLSSPVIEITSASEYFDLLKKQRVIVDQEERCQMIVEQNQKLAGEVGGCVPEDKELLDEVTQLVEYPACIRGGFPDRYLEIPREVVVTVMKKHQRYFPVEDKNGHLLPYFITVANHFSGDSELIREGNERVVAARLSDGEFFYSQDRKHKLEHFLPELKTIIFHERLGSVYEKSERLEKIVPRLADLFKVGTEVKKILPRAAHLCKADLATSLVREFPSLQGEIGHIYALEDGEDGTVARAIFEHHLPRFSGDKLPDSKPGQILAVADRLDTLVGFFAVGLEPQGSSDPYALRRAALGLIKVLVKLEKSVECTDLFAVVSQFLPIDFDLKEQKKLAAFIKSRILVDLKESSVRDDLVRAILSGPRAGNVYLVYKLARELSSLLEDKEFRDFVQAAKRVSNIVRGTKDPGGVDTHLFEKQAEVELFGAYAEAKKIIEKIAEDDVGRVISSYFVLVPPVNKFFEDVLVMTEDVKVQRNRLALLSKVNSLFNILFVPSIISLS